MATHRSARKRARQAQQRRERNRATKGRIKTAVREFRASLEADPTTAEQALRGAERELRKAASKGVVPQGRTSRSVSRLAKRLAHRGSGDPTPS